jgi:hypothetical protein
VPGGLNTADDRAPTLEEVQILEFPDGQIKTLVLTMVHSGIRIGAFETKGNSSPHQYMTKNNNNRVSTI